MHAEGHAVGRWLEGGSEVVGKVVGKVVGRWSVVMWFIGWVGGRMAIQGNQAAATRRIARQHEREVKSG